MPDRLERLAERRRNLLDAIEALVSSLPASADRIRRQFWRDSEFRTVCEDYRDALTVLAALEADPAANAMRVAEYRQLAAELLAEAALLVKEG